jgi:hypothetical protein
VIKLMLDGCQDLINTGQGLRQLLHSAFVRHVLKETDTTI